MEKLGTEARLYYILQYNVGGLGRKLYKFIDKLATDARLYCILQYNVGVLVKMGYFGGSKSIY